MKTLIPFSARHLRRSGAVLTLLASLLFAAPLVRAGLTFDVQFLRYQEGQSYRFYTPLNTNSTAPAAAQGTYVIYSPQFLASTNGAFRAFTIDSNGVNTIAGQEIPYPDFDSAMQQITNGTWSILFTNATTTNYYTFTVSAPNMTSNMLPATVITYPANDSINLPNQPTLAWDPPTGWGVSITNTYLYNYDFSFFEYASVPIGQYDWPVPSPLPNGLNLNFELSYVTNNVSPVFIATTPINTNASHQPISGWVSTDYLESDDNIIFAVTNPPVTTPVLVAHYTFDDPGNPGLDSSGNGYNLDFNGGDGVVSTNDAEAGNSAYFDGNSFLSYSSPPTNIMQTLSGDFSLSFWIKTTQNDGNEGGPAWNGAGIVAADIPGQYNDLVPAALDGGEIGFNTGGPFYDDTLNSTVDINDGSYHHVVITRTEATGAKQIYIDGSLNNSDSATMNPLSDPVTLAVGCAIDASQPDPNDFNPNNYFQGELDELQIYAGVLSSSQISGLYNNPGSTINGAGNGGLVAHYTFDNSGNIGADSSGNGNDLTFNGLDGVVSSADAEAGSGAASFDGYSFLSYNSAPPAILNAFAGSFSLSFWIKTTENDGNEGGPAWAGAGIVAADVPVTTNDIVPAALDGGEIGFNTGGSYDDTVNSTIDVNDNAYHHVVITRNQISGEKRIYIDGSLNNSDFATENLLNSPQLVAVGCAIDASQSDPNNANPQQFFQGLLDDIQIYSFVVSSNQVTELFMNPGTTVSLSSANFNPALNTTNLNWVTSGDSDWFTETTNTVDGLAAQSGSVMGDESSILSVTVTGPGTLTFYWSSIASDVDYGFDYEFSIDGNDEDDIYGDNGWYQDGPYTIGAGQHTLAWTVFADGDTDPTEAGYLDEVSFVTNSAPVITLNPFDQTNYPGYPVWLAAAASGSPAPSWQWYEVGSGAISGATKSYYQPTNAGTPEVAGSYYAIANSTVGSSITTTAAVSFVSAALPPDWAIAFKSPFTAQDDENPTRDYYYGCTVDANSNVYAAAEFGGAMTVGSQALNSGSGGDSAAVIKQTPTGTALWAGAITNNGSGSSYAECVAPAPGGGVYVSGNYNGNNWLGTTPLTDAGGGDMFLAYFNAGGTNVWVKTFGGTNQDFTLINSLASDASGNVTMIGLLGAGPVSIGSSNYNVAGQEGFILQVSQAGAVQWSQVLPSEFPQYVACSAGRLYVSLNTINNSGVTNVVIGGISNVTDRAWAVACLNDTNGEAIWVKGVGARNGSGNGDPYYTGLEDDVPRLAVSGDNVFLTGVAYDYSAEFGALTVNFALPRGQYFARYDTNGNAQVATTYGSVTTTPEAAVANAGGDVYVSGDFQDYAYFGNDLLGAPSNSMIYTGQFNQGFLAKFDSNGNSLWARQAVAPWNVNFLGIGLAPDGVWASGWGIGTNGVAVQSIVFGTNHVFSDPLELVGGAGGGSIIVWQPGGMLGKVDDVASAPLAINLTSPHDNGTNFLVSFQTQSGFTHSVEYRTNLVAGTDWQTYTNVTGNGTVQTVPIPLSVFGGSRQGFVRVMTQ